MRRANIPSSPPPKRIAIGFRPNKNAASENPPSRASPTSFIAVFPKRQIAIAITAMTAALVPPRSDTAGVKAPNLMYAHANIPVIRAAGMMKLTPAMQSPDQPARTKPTLIAISVEVGPGIRLAAPSMSRNCCCVTHCRLRTTSASMRASSRRQVPRDAGGESWVSCGSFTPSLWFLPARLRESRGGCFDSIPVSRDNQKEQATSAWRNRCECRSP